MADTTTAYPKRESFYAARFVRLTVKCGLALRLGSDAVMLLHAIVSMEDELRYSGPVYYPADTLAMHAGIKSKPTFLAARKRLVEAGWLHYERGTKGQAAGYWVTVPATHRGLFGAAIGAAREADTDGPDRENQVKDKVKEIDLETHQVKVKVKDKVKEIDQELDPYNPNPGPSPSPANAGHSASEKPRREWRFSDWDAQFARRMFQDIRRLVPTAKEPTYGAWANELRLMREQDARPPTEIEAVWSWTHADSFWKSNVLSPAKLREKWDQLQAKRATHGKRNERPREPWENHRPPSAGNGPSAF